VSKAKALLEQSKPFNEFDDAILSRFIAEAREQEFSAGDVLFYELSEGNEIYFIVTGEIRMSVELASAYHMVEEIEGGPGELVGEGRFIADGPRPATATATSDLTALVWDVAAWKAIAEDSPKTGYRLAIYAGQVLFARVGELRDHLINDISWGLE
jgi:CRP-like cAMP-binding protein